MTSRPRLRYIELLSGHAQNGPAWIAIAQASKSGARLYFNGKALARIEGSRHMDIETLEIYWVANVKKDGRDRHYTGSGKVSIEKGAVPSYLRLIGAESIDTERLKLIDDLPPTDLSRFHDMASAPLASATYEAARSSS